MKKIYVCSKLRGDIEKNIGKAEVYCKFVISKGHIPYAPHIYFTHFINDNIPEERKIGIKFGIEWLKECDEIWVFDSDISDGMKKEIDFAKRNKISIILKF